MNRVVRVVVLVVAVLLAAVPPGIAAGTAELLRDINLVETPGVQNYGIRGPLVQAGARVVFAASTPGSGSELWASDGTSLGTELIRETVPGEESSEFVPVGTVGGVAVLLVGNSAGESHGLWRSDGTPEGTFQIADAARCFEPPRGAVVGSLLFFTAASSAGCELWKTDGTAAGTGVVKNGGPDARFITGLTSAGGRLFLFSGFELWTSDGTSAGTVLLQSFARRGDDGLPELTSTGSRVFFLAPVPGRGEELWTSDGTPAGTRPVTDFAAPAPFAAAPYESVVTVIGGVLYFFANDGTGIELWQSDGTVGGVRRVTDFASPFPFPREIEPVPMVTRLGARLVFPAVDEGGGWRLWTSQGTPQTTKPLVGCPGGCPKVAATPLVRIGNRAVFASIEPPDGTRSGLWVTDGTGSGTRRLADFCRTCGGDVSRIPLIPLLGRVFFLAPGSQGVSLWKTDGTVEGTIRLALLGDAPFSAFSPFSPVAAGGKVFFAAEFGERGPQLWGSDGTPAGTGLVTLISGTPGSSPSGFVPFNGGVLFSACDGEAVSVWRSEGTDASPLHPPGEGVACAGLEPPRPVVAGGIAFYILSQEPFSANRRLWRSDGTVAGTFAVTPEGIGEIRQVVALGNRAVFLVSTSIPEPPFSQATFWESNGTVAGTRPLFPADPAFSPRLLEVVGSRLFFLATDLASGKGEQLWVTDGTAPPRVISDVLQAFEAFQPLEIAQVGATVFFMAGKRLWKTDGTLAGTSAVPFPASTEGYWPWDFVAFRGALYFTAGTAQGSTHRGLWRSDGTAAGTLLVKPVGTLGAWPAVLGDRLYFAGEDGEHGLELWTSDGTEAGTVMVRDIFPGKASSRPSWLAAAGGRLYFAAGDGNSGVELWESDGTTAGTHRVQDIAPAAGSSNPKELTVSGDRLFFAADDGLHGEEPWVLGLASGSCVPAEDALCLGGRFRVEADWRDFQGHLGKGRAVALTGDTGTFWFFDAANVEVVLKVLDGRGVNDHFWVFYGALSNVEYSLTVTDTQTGAVRRYVNPPGRLASVSDVEAFGPRGANRPGVVTLGPAPARSEAPKALQTAQELSVCEPSANRLCLGNGRFAAEIVWKRPGGTSAPAMAVPLPGGDTGYFWFLGPGNVEVMLKVLDGRGINGHHWVFYGALSDLEYQVTVTDTLTGIVRIYNNPRGRLASVADTAAF